MALGSYVARKEGGPCYAGPPPDGAQSRRSLIPTRRCKRALVASDSCSSVFRNGTREAIGLHRDPELEHMGRLFYREHRCETSNGLQIGSFAGRPALMPSPVGAEARRAA
jgi:hypothetical protein